MVHNAGITRDKLLANMTPDTWDSVIAVNIAAQLRINEALLAVRTTSRTRRGSSRSRPPVGIAGNRGQTNYAASKAGVIGMVRATAPLLAADGGTANAVAPGFIETEMTARIPSAHAPGRPAAQLAAAGRPAGRRRRGHRVPGLPAGRRHLGRVLRVCGQNLVGA